MGVMVDRFVLTPREPKTVVSANSPQQTSRAVAKPAEQNAPASSATPPVSPPAHKPTGEPALTFYETLPKGGKTILGSGMNPKHPEIRSVPLQKAVAPTPASTTENQQVEAKPQPKREASVKSPEPADKKVAATERAEKDRGSADVAKQKTAEKKTSPSKGKFSVQVASAKTREEADAVKAKLQEKGFAAYIVESTIPGKGTWYRVRVGRQMEQAAAGNLASLLGKGAILIPE